MKAGASRESVRRGPIPSGAQTEMQARHYPSRTWPGTAAGPKMTTPPCGVLEEILSPIWPLDPHPLRSRPDAPRPRQGSIVVLDAMLEFFSGGKRWTRSGMAIYDGRNRCLVGALQHIRAELSIRGDGTFDLLHRALPDARKKEPPIR